MDSSDRRQGIGKSTEKLLMRTIMDSDPAGDNPVAAATKSFFRVSSCPSVVSDLLLPTVPTALLQAVRAEQIVDLPSRCAKRQAPRRGAPSKHAIGQQPLNQQAPQPNGRPAAAS